MSSQHSTVPERGLSEMTFDLVLGPITNAKWHFWRKSSWRSHRSLLSLTQSDCKNWLSSVSVRHEPAGERTINYGSLLLKIKQSCEQPIRLSAAAFQGLHPRYCQWILVQVEKEWKRKCEGKEPKVWDIWTTRKDKKDKCFWLFAEQWKCRGIVNP